MSIERLKQLLSYDPETGVFRWIAEPKGGRKIGAVAGQQDGKYWRINVDRKLHRAHRLAWAFVHGEWPADQIDHRDNNPLNNAISNLRPASNAKNCANRGARSDSKSGVRGVCWHKRSQMWIAKVTKDGVEHHVGYFASLDEARAARNEAATRLHGEFVRNA